MSQILGALSPFDPVLLDHTEAQLDYILESFSIENPKVARFVRERNAVEPLGPAAKAAAWEKVLVGKAKSEMMSSFMPSEAVLKKLQDRGTAAAAINKYAHPKIVRGPGK